MAVRSGRTRLWGGVSVRVGTAGHSRIAKIVVTYSVLIQLQYHLPQIYLKAMPVY